MHTFVLTSQSFAVTRSHVPSAYSLPFNVRLCFTCVIRTTSTGATQSPVTTDQDTRPILRTRKTEAPTTITTTAPVPTSAVASSSKATSVPDAKPVLTMDSRTKAVKPVLTMDSRTKGAPGALTPAPPASTAGQNLRLTTAGTRANARNKVRTIFRDRDAAANQLKQNYGLEKILEISAVSELSDSDDGKKMIQSVTLKGYSLTTFTQAARNNFCKFISNQAGLLAGMCEILSVTSDASSASSSADDSGRRILQGSVAVHVKFAVWYNAQDLADSKNKAANKAANNDAGGNGPVVATVVAIIVILVVALVAGVVVYLLRTKRNNPVVPQSFTNLYAPNASTEDDFSYSDNSNQLEDDETLSLNEQDDKFSVGTF